MAKTTVLKPIYAPTDFERQRMQELAMQAPSVDPYIAELMDGPGGGIRLGAQGALATAILERGMMAVERAFSPTTTPLNLTLSKSQADPLKDDMSVFMRNNPESIAEDLNQIPSDEHPWILSAPDFETYQQRVEYVKRGENKELGSTAGYALGMAADMGLLTTMGLVAEPLALAGLGTRTTMAGRVGAQVLGREGTKTLATAAAEAATTVSRLNLGGRYLTLGVAEEAVYQAAKQGIDPLYDPTFGEAMFDFVLSGSLAGGIGGVAFGRTFVKENIEAAVKDFKAARTVDLPGGYKVTYSSWGFDSPAAADKMLFAPGTGNLAFEADRVAGDLWADWSRTGTFGTSTFNPIVDLSIPGTRTLNLPILDEATMARPGETGESLWETITNKQNFFDAFRSQFGAGVTLDSLTPIQALEALRSRGLIEFADNNSPFFDYAGRLGIMVKVGDMRVPFYISTGLGGKAKVPAGKWYPFFGINSEGWMVKLTEAEILKSYDSPLLKNIQSFLDEVIGDLDTAWSSLHSGAKTLDEARSAADFFKREFGFTRMGALQGYKHFEAILRNIGKSTVRPEVLNKADYAQVKSFIETFVSDLTGAARGASAGIRDASGRIPAKPKMGKLVGLRSAIKAVAFELSLAGAKLDRELFAKIGEVLVRVDQQKLKAGGFNKAFWDELLSTVDPEVASRVRKVGEREFIPGIDKSVLDVARREDMVTSVWDAFRQRQHLEPNAPKSLIFEVLQEIRNRGGKVDRAMVSNVIDELRKISQTPPKRLNRKGVMTLDVTGRRAQVIEIINKRVTDNRQIFIDPSLIKRMSSDVAARVDTPAVAASSIEARGTAADASDVPVNRVRIPFWDRIGNQSALVHQSKNGWARLIGNYAFFARRDMGEAQAHTIFEWGTQKLYAASAMFTKGYRNGFIRFALGGGTQNVSQNVTLTDQFVTMLRQRKMRAEFDARVVKQLRTGAYDDAVDAVNDTAKGIREMFNKVFDLAHSAGLNGFQKSARVNYMPRMWRWDRIRRLATTPKGRASLESLVKQAIDQDGRRVVIDGVEEVFTEDIDAAAKVFTNRLISIAQGEEAAPMIQQEQDLFQAILDLEGPLKAKTGSRTPYGRAAIMLNETVVMQDPDDSLALGKDVLGLADLMHDDLPYVFRTYVTSVMGAINERRMIDAFNAELKARGVLSPVFMSKNGLTQKDITVQTVGEMVALAKKLGGGIESQHEEGIKELMAAIRYEPIHHGRTRLTDRILPVLQSFGYLTTGGQFGLAALSEVSRIVSTVGLGNTLRQMPILAEMVTNWKNLDSDGKNFASAIDAWFSPSTDRLRRSLSDQWDALRDTSSTSRFEKGLQRTANFMSDISLLSPVTSFSQHLTAAATLQHLVEAAKGGRRLDDSLVRTLGLTPERYQNLIDWVGRNAVTEKRFMGERVVDLRNIDAKEMVELAQFVDRMVRTRIQDIPTRGDFAKGMFSFLGKLLTQFRTFNLKGVDNFLLQNISRSVNGGSPQVMAEIASTMVFAGTIQYLRNYGDWKSYESVNNYEKMDEIEKNLDIAGFIRGAVAGPSEFFVPTLLTDTMWTRFVDKDPIFSPYRYSGLSMYGFPAQAMLSRADSVFGDFYGASVGKALGLDVERETTRGTIHRARLLLPFQNMFGLKQYFNIAETQIADWLRAPEQQPRRTRD